MSWLFSQALGEEYLAANSLDREQSVPSSGTPMLQGYCAPDKMTEFSRLSQFGATYAPLTESRGEDVLTWFLEDSLVRTCQSQDTGMDWMESGLDFGERCPEL